MNDRMGPIGSYGLAQEAQRQDRGALFDSRLVNGPIPGAGDTVTNRLQHAVEQLRDGHNLVSLLEEAILGPHPQPVDKVAPAPPIGVNALSHDLASASEHLHERLRALLAVVRQ